MNTVYLYLGRLSDFLFTVLGFLSFLTINLSITSFWQGEVFHTAVTETVFWCWNNFYVSKGEVLLPFWDKFLAINLFHFYQDDFCFKICGLWNKASTFPKGVRDSNCNLAMIMLEDFYQPLKKNKTKISSSSCPQHTPGGILFFKVWRTLFKRRLNVIGQIIIYSMQSMKTDASHLCSVFIRGKMFKFIRNFRGNKYKTLLSIGPFQWEMEVFSCQCIVGNVCFWTTLLIATCVNVCTMASIWD